MYEAGGRESTHCEEIVLEWLRTLRLDQYTQAFIDNGYDDLEICKQIGEPDLDAIGVEETPHRDLILSSVKVLRSHDPSSHFYHILEKQHQNYDLAKRLSRHTDTDGVTDDENKENIITDEYAEGRRAFVTYTKLHLCDLVREMLTKYGIKLNQKPFVMEDGTFCTDALEDLAHKLASDLRTHPQDVLDRLYDLMDFDASPSDQAPNADDDVDCTMYSLAGQSSRSVPPPLPAYSSELRAVCDNGRISRTGSPAKHQGYAEQGIHPEVNITDREHSLQGEKSRDSGSISKLLGTLRGRSPKKHIYRKHAGDLNASEITMCENERIQLMLMVKDGSIAPEQAVEAVKIYETRRRKELFDMERSSSAESKVSSKAMRHCGVISPFLFFKFPSQRRKKSATSQETSSRSSSSLTSSPRSSNAQSNTKLYEGTGTQMYSPVHGARTKTIDTNAKSGERSFSSPKGSPVRQFRWAKTFSSDKSSPKSKKKSGFSSPFSLRKKSSKPKDLWESPQRSVNSFQDDSGVCVSPGSRCDSTDRISQVSQDCEHISSPETRIHSDPSNARGVMLAATPTHVISPVPSDSMQPSTKYCDIRQNCQQPLTSFQTFHKRLSSDLSQARQLETSLLIARNSDPNVNNSVFSETNLTDKVALTHKTREADMLSTYARANSDSSLRHIECYNDTTCMHICSRDGLQEMQQDIISTKRHTSPSVSPSHSQSPKRKHFSSSPNSTINKPDEIRRGCPGMFVHPDNNQHYGSNSTMSVGSDFSPSCTIERNTLKQHELVRRNIDQRRGRSHSFSTGDEYFSSDHEDAARQGGFELNAEARRSTEDSAKSKKCKTRKLRSKIITNPRVCVTNPNHEDTRHRKEGTNGSSTCELGGYAHHSPVERVLRRIGLLHLAAKFREHNITSLTVLCDMTDVKLEAIGVQHPMERAKILTVASVLSDFEDHSSGSTHSSVPSSPCHAAFTPSSTHNPSLNHLPSTHTHLNGVSSRPEAHKRSISPALSISSTSTYLPFYENIDNFEEAIPEEERVLTHFTCQCEFDSTLPQVIHAVKSPDQQHNPVFYNAQSHPHHIPKAKVRSRTPLKKPSVPETNVLDSPSSSGSNSPSKSPAKYKDASTQHGGILHMLMKSGSLVKSSPSPGSSPAHRAETTLFKTKHSNKPCGADS